MATRINNYQIVSAPVEVREDVENDMDLWVHNCFLRKETVIENFYKKWGETPDIEIQFEDDFGIGTFYT